MQETGTIYGSSINLYLMNNENRDLYLDVYKVASNLSDLYKTSDELWEAMSELMGTEEDKAVRYIVAIKDSKDVCGFINYEIKGRVPWIDIAILKEHRHKGYGFEAAKILCNYLLSKNDVDYIYWFAKPNNAPSIKIAEKLGGEKSNDRDILAEAVAKEFGEGVLEYKDLLSLVSYVIKTRTL